MCKEGGRRLLGVGWGGRGVGGGREGEGKRDGGLLGLLNWTLRLQGGVVGGGVRVGVLPPIS